MKEQGWKPIALGLIMLFAIACMIHLVFVWMGYLAEREQMALAEAFLAFLLAQTVSTIEIAHWKQKARVVTPFILRDKGDPESHAIAHLGDLIQKLHGKEGGEDGADTSDDEDVDTTDNSDQGDLHQVAAP